MGRIANVLSFARGILRTAKVTSVKGDAGGGYIVTGQNFSAPGDDSMPLVGDYALLVNTTGNGNIAVAGYVNPEDEQIALAGEKRLYARSEAGETVGTLHLKKDGTVTAWNSKITATMYPDGSATLTNGSGAMSLLDNGDFNINGVVIKPDGSIITPTGIETPSAIVGGKEINNHTHPVTTAPGTTGVNN